MWVAELAVEIPWSHMEKPESFRVRQSQKYADVSIVEIMSWAVGASFQKFLIEPIERSFGKNID